jgi:L-fuculose-phosphate aldolase
LNRDLESVLRQKMLDICRNLYSRGLIAGADGNVSAPFQGGDRILTTPSGVHKGSLSVDDFVVVDRDGAVIRGEARPSSELRLHLAIYREDPAAGAVIHTHAPWTTALSLSGRGLSPHLLVEAKRLLGEVPIVPYEEPGTKALAEAVAVVLALGPAQILAHHGAVTRGPDLERAFQLMECLEHTSKITAIARMLGDPLPLPE